MGAFGAASMEVGRTKVMRRPFALFVARFGVGRRSPVLSFSEAWRHESCELCLGLGIRDGRLIEVYYARGRLHFTVESHVDNCSTAHVILASGKDTVGPSRKITDQ